jgi:hypothetical protein
MPTVPRRPELLTVALFVVLTGARKPVGAAGTVAFVVLLVATVVLLVALLTLTWEDARGKTSAKISCVKAKDVGGIEYFMAARSS